MAEAAYTGLTASVKLGGHPTGNTIGYINGISLELSKDIIDILAFGMTYKEKVPAIKDWSLSIDGTVAFAATYPQEVLYDAFEDGTLLVFTIYLNATTYFEGSGYIKSLNIETAPDDSSNISAEISGSGPLTFVIAGGTGMMVFTPIDHATAGATQVPSVVPTLTGGNAYYYKINATLPPVGADYTDMGYTAYTLEAAIPCVNGDIVTLIETLAGVVVLRGMGTAVVTA